MPLSTRLILTPGITAPVGSLTVPRREVFALLPENRRDGEEEKKEENALRQTCAHEPLQKVEDGLI